MSTALSTEMPTSAARSAGGRVINAVAHETDDVALAAERFDDPLFMARREAGRNVSSLGGLSKLLIGHVFHFRAEDDFFGFQAHIAADLAGDKLVVAREDFTAIPCCCKAAMAFKAVSLGGSRNAHVTLEHQLGFVGLGIGRARLHFLVGTARTRETVGAEGRGIAQ